MNKNKTEYLNNLLKELTDDGFDDVVFRRNMGWYGVFCDARYFYDNGEYLGKDWKEAEGTLRKFYE